MIIRCHMILIVLIVLPLQNIYAYEIETHEKISSEVTDHLWKNNNSVLDDINIGYTSKITGKTIRLLVSEGAKFEDNTDLIKRPHNHFYDPYNNIGLNSWIGIKSPSWALEDDELNELPEQEFSLLDASDYLYHALSLYDSKEREKNFGKRPE